MSIPADTLRQIFDEYRYGTILEKKDLVQSLLGYTANPEEQKKLLMYALDYDILHPLADGKQNSLCSSEISVVLFKRVFAQLPKEIDRGEFLAYIFSNISLDARRTLAERPYKDKAGKTFTKTIVPFAIAYHVFITLIFFDVSVLSLEELLRYRNMTWNIQILKNQLRYIPFNATAPWLKLHNWLTTLEQFKLNFLKEHYHLSIETLTRACQCLEINPQPLVIPEEEALLQGAQNDVDRVQLQIMLELNKLAYGQANTFGALRFDEPKPIAYSDRKKPSVAQKCSVSQVTSASPNGISFWQEQASKFNRYLGYGASELCAGLEGYYYFPSY